MSAPIDRRLDSVELFLISTRPAHANELRAALGDNYVVSLLDPRGEENWPKSDKPSLILIDQDHRPSGLEAMSAAVNAKPTWVDVPLAVIAAHHDPQQEEQAFRLGAAEYLLWTSQPRVLKARVSRCSERSSDGVPTDPLASDQALANAFFEHCPLTFSIRDLAGRYIQVNPHAAEFLGISPDEFVGKRPEQTPGTAQRLERYDALVRQHRREVTYERPFLTPSGERRLRLTAFPIVNRTGELTAIGRVGIDVSDNYHDDRARQAQEEIINRQDAMFASFLEHAPYAISLRDLHGRYLLVTASSARKIGRSMADVIGRTNEELNRFAPETRAVIKVHEDKVIALKEAVTEQRPESDTDGVVTERLVTKFPVFEADGTMFAIGTVDLDVTELDHVKRALAEQAESFQSLVQGSIQGIAIIRDMELRFANQAFADIHGYRSPDEMISSVSVIETVSLRDRAWIRSLADRRSRGEAVAPRYEYRAIRKDGTEIVLQCIVNPTHWQGESVNQIAVIDITEQRQAEDSLRASEARLSALVDYIPHALSIKSLDGRYQLVNPANLQVTGLANKESILGKRPADVFPRETAAALVSADIQVATTGQMLEVEQEWEFAGQRLFMNTVTFPIFGRDGKISAIGRIGTDITERRLAEEKRRQSEARFRAFFENSPHAMSIQDIDGRYLEENPGAARLYGLNIDQVRGKLPSQIWESPMAARVEAINKRVRYTLEPQSYEDEVEVGRAKKWIDIAKFPILLEDGSLQGIGSISSDLSAWKQADREVRRSRQRFIDFAEASSDWFWEMNRECKFVNVSGQRAGPVDEDTITRLNSSRRSRDGDIANQQLAKDWEEFWSRVRNRSPIRNVEVPIRNQDEIRHFQVSGKVLYDDEGEFAGYRGVASDITEVVRSNRQAAMLRTAIDASTDATVLYDENSQLVFSSRRYHEIFPTLPPQSDIAGMHREQVVELIAKGGGFDARSSSESGAANHARQTDSGSESAGEVRHYANGRAYLRVQGDAGQGGILVQLHDITELQQAQRELEAYQAELRKLASEVSLAEERERRRIATELHDGAVQNLGLARIRVGTLSRKFEDQRTTAELVALRDLLAVAVRELRLLMSELSPPMLYELGLPPALEWLAGKFTEQHNLNCAVSLPESQPHLPDDLTVILFQAARELLMNVVKHAGAESARIVLCADKHRVALIISDDGVGIDPERLTVGPSDSGGFGLFSLRERVEHLGGRFTAARLESGTEITIEVPRTLQGN